MPDDPALNPVYQPGFWVGMGMMQTLFAMEHNAICDMLAAAYPAFDDETLFQRARLVLCALLAKIHTVEWTPAVTAHPTAVTGLRANWWGLEGERLHNAFGRLSSSEIVSGITGGETDDYGVPFALTEEFVAVYRMHPLIPDDFDFRSVGTDAPTLGPTGFDELAGPAGAEVLRTNRLVDLLYTFGTMNPGLVCLHNFPKYLQTFRRPDTGALMDLSATDIVRCRELGVPRYTAFRRLLHLPVPETFEDITSNKQWAAELREVYNGDIDSVDLLPGMFAEDRPEGFAFSDTAFRIFILMASRRLNSDRFFTTHFTDEVYTPEGIKWIEDNTMVTVLTRHFPELEPYVGASTNAFGIWERPRHVSRLRFWLYRNILAFFTLLAFRWQKVYPLEVPVDGTVEFRPYAELYPEMPIKGLYLPTTFPPSDRAPERLKRIRRESRLIAFVRWVAPQHTATHPDGRAALPARRLSVVLPEGVADSAHPAGGPGEHRRPGRRARHAGSVRERTAPGRRRPLRVRLRLGRRLSRWHPASPSRAGSPRSSYGTGDWSRRPWHRTRPTTVRG